MLKRLKNKIIVLLLIFLITGCVNQNNQANNQKLAVTSVSILEILNELQIPSNQIIGVPKSNYELPETYQDIQTIGAPMSPDLETISSLSPLYVISPLSLQGELEEKYKKANLSSIFMNLNNVSGMFKSIEELGKLLEIEDKSKTMIEQYVKFIQDYRNKYVGKDSPRVLILMGLPGSYVVASESSYVGDLLKLAGASNVYGDGGGKDYLQINPEDMLQQNPDIILRTSHALPDQVKEMFANEFKDNAIWSNFDAVKNNKVYDLDNELFGMSANLKYQEAMNYLEDILYGTN